MFARFRRRYLDVLGSIYIYNEHRGYTSIDRVLEAVQAHCPDDAAFIAAIHKHRADERKHYVMFRRWFDLQGRMPLAVDRACGHIDRFVEIVFGSTIDDLDTKAVIASEALFERLCRVIMLTEMRGMRQVDTLLKSPLVRSDPVLVRIFRIIERDEPSHWQPYRDWLVRTGRPQAKRSERLVDLWVHRELLFVKLPLLFPNPWLPRRTDWADAGEPEVRRPQPRARTA
ncbi:ferritin-like domain-containing protein [Sphingomonas immobilis]|uniref:Ferritin-like domain-containing protein n=1 Tax=Sphingomonas immobilis TaxID=3063997 RepID=A0ABT9A3Z5_9SPHN|nr:ferritin-like domain-containing protein [Sphingomonas sp. CA1-15]MDO7844572.1 ferritin-like domain-containing protein [Sphingomonas sp. CA1-15]